MAWDLRLNPLTWDLTSGIVTGQAEIVQRLVTRLRRELGEWFLNTDAGLPWYQDGQGLLGSKNETITNLLIRQEVRDTEGVERIIALNSLFFARQYQVYMQLILTPGNAIELTMTNDGFVVKYI